MERVNFGYSLKNIPIPHKTTYIKSFIDKTDKFIRRMRWKIFHYDNNTDRDNEEASRKSNYGFPSESTPPPHNALVAFENDLFELINKLEFSNHRTHFQRKLAADVKEIRSSNLLYVPADKTTNVYKLEPEVYGKLLTDNVTANYRTAALNVKHKIDADAKVIAKSLKLDDRVEQLAERTAFITLKDHKENFDNNPKCRLLNPAKSEIGKISRSHLQRINSEIRAATSLNQWRNTSTVIEWFRNIGSKNDRKFVQLDIVEFYPSITKALLDRALEFASTYTSIPEQVVEIIHHSRASVLFANDNVWVKKDGNLFDVTMGSFDGAEICELVGLYLLHVLQQKFPMIDFGLYRDDALGTYTSIPGPACEKIRKQIIQTFKDNDLKITIDMNMRTANFLDCTFDLVKDAYYPYKKENNQLLYINKESNHPPNIKKQLPMMIEKRLSDLSCDASAFEKARPDYEKALKDSGFQHELKYTCTPPKRRTRTRNVLWFNPPYNATVTTNVGRIFLALISKHFPAHSKYSKIFNRNTVKISYSCTPNIKSIITSHNKNLLTQGDNDTIRPCNCKNYTCPLNGDCRRTAVIYKATVNTSDKNKSKEYVGMTEQEFKTRFYNHESSFRNVTHRNNTTLSQYVWKLKEESEPFTIKWNLLTKARPYTCGSRKCDLCLTEKYEILKNQSAKSLNKRSEIAGSCRHRAKFKLKNLK